MTATRTSPYICPLCGYTFDSHSTLDDSGAVPAPGDLTVCISCVGVLEYDGSMRLKIASQAEVERELAVPGNDLGFIIMGIRRAHAAFGVPKVQRGTRQ